jgi:hypothetical protein
MTRRILSLAALAVLCLPAAIGCDGCAEPLTELGGPDDELPVGDLTPTGDRVLTYVGEDPMGLLYGESATLRFTWKTTTGEPVVGESLTVLSTGDAITPINSALVTDSGGGVDVVVTAGNLTLDSTLIARGTDLDGSIDEDSVLIRVTEDPVAGLRVTVESEARIDVVTADVRILVGSAPPTCAALLAPGAIEPLPQLEGAYATIPSTQEFTGLPARAIAVVVADGKNEDGVVVAKGCADAGQLPGGSLTDVTVLLGQGITRLDGSYDVLMHMALGDALPAPYDATVELVTALLANPAGYALWVTLREIDQEVGTEFVTRDGVLVPFRDVEQDPTNFPTWNFGQQELDGLLASQLGQTYVDVTNVGAGIRDVTTDFEVGARFALADDQLSDDPTRLAMAESWQAMVLYWPLPCDDGDLACARRLLTLDDANLTPVASEYGASYAFAPVDSDGNDRGERFAVTTDPHGLNVRYGAFLLAILEQVVFPSLPGDVSADNLGDLLSNLVGCTNIAQSLSDDPVAQFFAQSMCEAALDIAAQQIEDQLLQLEVGAANPELGEEGLLSGGTFALIDEDQDLTTEIVEEYVYNVAWNDPNDPNVVQDISAPITGDGLRVLPTCTDDLACGVASGPGFTCSARAKYTKTDAVEYVCARSKGDVVGGSACVGDGDCASGLCAPVGAGGSLQCFRACDAITDCGAGQICGTGGTLDLDTVLDGLGDVELQGCSAP